MWQPNVTPKSGKKRVNLKNQLNCHSEITLKESVLSFLFPRRSETRNVRVFLCFDDCTFLLLTESERQGPASRRNCIKTFDSHQSVTNIFEYSNMLATNMYLDINFTVQ